jgi:hypothetical protein
MEKMVYVDFHLYKGTVSQDGFGLSLHVRLNLGLN